MTLEQQLLNAGIPLEQIDHHESDLYVLKTDVSSKVLNTYEFKGNIETFISQTEPYKSKVWYDIPFAYIRGVDNHYESWETTGFKTGKQISAIENTLTGEILRATYTDTNTPMTPDEIQEDLF